MPVGSLIGFIPPWSRDFSRNLTYKRIEHLHESTWVFPKIGVPPNHPFWGTTIFGDTHIAFMAKKMSTVFFSTVLGLDSSKTGGHVFLFIFDPILGFGPT